MKMVFDFARYAGCQPKDWIVCLALALVVTAGCGKSNSSADPAAPPVTSDTTSNQQNQTDAPLALQNPQPVVAVNPDDSQKMLQGLNRALLGWTIRNRRHPQTFEEFADSANIQIPAPPAGKKYTLNSDGFIILVSN